MLGYDRKRKSESDSDNDSDYAPPPGADEASLSSEDEQPESKRARSEVPESKKKALWESFQASVNGSSSTMTEPAAKRVIKVCKRYRFAGEEVTEVVEVPEDSPDAKKWPVWHSPDGKEASSPTSEEPVLAKSSENPNRTPDMVNPPNPPPGKRPGPRKPKTRLPELPGRSSSTKVKKLTTLDKSVMDWKAHVQSSENEVLQDELEANRRGGGYLDKVEFLQRVDERKDAILDATSSKRKRG